MAGDTGGDAVQPARQSLRPADQMGFAKEYDKGFLTGVFGRVAVIQEATTDAPHHAAMASHQGLEGRLVVVAKEPPQELAVAHLVGPWCADALVDGTEVLAG
jgi:hypothetical protein